MHEKDLFEYAVIRLVPSVERQEFLNVGIILYCPDAGHLSSEHELNESKVRSFSDNINLDEVRDHLAAIERICRGGSDAGSIGRLSPGERFRWLTAPRSTIVQTSPVHTGVCKDADATMRSLMDSMVR